MSSNSGHKRISIITICKNSERFLQDSIESVVAQECSDYELIVVDGASTDNTLEIIRKYDQYISKWVSEPDQGIADAMNKGVEMSSGDYVYFLHSDDYLLANDTLGAVLGNLTDAKIQVFELFYRVGDTLHKLTPRGFNFWMWFKYGILHQATLCHRSVFDEIGNFDTQFKIAMDYDFFLRAYKHGVSISKHFFPISVMRDTGISSQLDWESLEYRFSEEQLAQKKNRPSALLQFFHLMFWPLYIGYRKARSKGSSKN